MRIHLIQQSIRTTKIIISSSSSVFSIHISLKSLQEVGPVMLVLGCKGLVMSTVLNLSVRMCWLALSGSYLFPIRYYGEWHCNVVALQMLDALSWCEWLWYGLLTAILNITHYDHYIYPYQNAKKTIDLVCFIMLLQHNHWLLFYKLRCFDMNVPPPLSLPLYDHL